MTHFRGKGVTVEASRFALIRKEHFTEMLYRIPELGQPLIALMSDRVRSQARANQQREKMMALGKLSAGLAHELNNPAAAVGRAAASLQDRLAKQPTLVARLARHGLTEDEVCAVDRLRLRASSQSTGSSLSSVQQSELEDEMSDWLEQLNLEKSWMMAETFVESGIHPDELAAALSELPEETRGDVVAWVESSIASDRLLAEINASADRISGLIASVKSYSHMDGAIERQAADIRVGIDSTITMLAHKLKKKGIHVERGYQDDLPHAPVYVDELNQVWTNLIDNAIDAMKDNGTLRIEAESEGDAVFVRVIDNGEGIPSEIQSRIFEPFFTTKGVGEGTGLGLDIVERIVRQTHNGNVRIESEPGRTVFEVQLPLAESSR
jgi:signal transduction histidine kinase